MVTVHGRDTPDGDAHADFDGLLVRQRLPPILRLALTGGASAHFCDRIQVELFVLHPGYRVSVVGTGDRAVALRSWSDAAFRFAEEVSVDWGPGFAFRAGRSNGTHIHPAEPPFTDLNLPLSWGGDGADFRITTVPADAARAALPSPNLGETPQGSRLLRLEGPGPAVEWIIGAQGDMIGLDPIDKRAVHLTALPLHPADLVAPLRNELVWLASLGTACVMHAAAVGADGRGVLVLGGGGAGKSTLTVSALAAGLESCGDDYVWVDRTRSGYVAHRLYRSVKLDSGGPAQRALGPDFYGRGFPVDGGRTGYVLKQQGRFSLTDRLEIQGLVLLDPAMAGEATCRVTPREVLTGPGVSTLSQQHRGQRHAWRFIAELGGALPVYSLPARTNPGRMVEQIESLLQSPPTYSPTPESSPRDSPGTRGCRA